MSLTSLGDRKTPGRPIEIAYAPETGLPSNLQELMIIGHRGSGAASGSSGVTTYSMVQVSNVADVDAASGEVGAKVGYSSELLKMVLAAVRANQSGGVFPTIKMIPLAYGDTGFGASDEALVTAKRYKAELLVSPYDGTDDTLRDKIKAAAQVMSGPERVENNQFGTVAVVFNRDTVDPADLPAPDSQYLMPVWLRDTGSGDDAPAYSVAEMAAACAARAAGVVRPFKPLDNVTIDGIAAPAKQSDWPTVGYGLETETALAKGWTPLRVKANGEVAFVRTVTSRITNGNGVAVNAYYDLQDFQVLYDFRRTLFTRFNQPDLKLVKASQETAKQFKGEVLRLAQVYEDQGMFQNVSKLSKYFKVERSASDRHRFDILVPVNVVPGLHVVATRIEAGTLFDSFSI